MSYYNSTPSHKSSPTVQSTTTHSTDSYVRLGDVVEKVLDVVGVHKVLNAVVPKKKGCGCAKRKKLLNKIKLYKKNRR